MRKDLGLLIVVALVTTMTMSIPHAAGAATGNWYMTDLHQHSSFSGDARADPGINAAIDRSLGYNAVMLTDHDRGAQFQIQGANGNYLSFTDALSGRWLQKTTGPATGTVNAISTSVKHGGTSSLELKVASTSSSAARTMVYVKRGTTLRAGGIVLDFWVYPQAINTASGVDVSVSLGGDATTATQTYGYTAGGTPVVGKSTVLVWQMGSARAPATSGSTHVYVNDLGYTIGSWNHYTIDVRSGTTNWTDGNGTTTQLAGLGLSGLPAADAPADYDVLSEVKMEAASTGGTADAFFDDYVLKDLAPNCPAADFVYRNSLIDAGQFNGTNAKGGPFVMYPAREMGQNDHTNQFNFDIKSPGDYYDAYSDTSVPAGYGNDATLCNATNNSAAPWRFSYYGADNIPAVQASGYPAQNNHAGVTDTVADVVQTQAHGADLIEAQTGADYTSAWDSILQQNHIVIGTYGSDAHEGVTSGAPATVIYAPSLSLDDLTHSLDQGLVYLARNNFTGRVVFNLDGSASPYPARTPVEVAAGTTSASVTLDISGGLSSGQTIRWITNNGSGPAVSTDPVSSATYRRTFTVPISGTFTYVRAEVRDSSNKLIANTEPIFFELPAPPKDTAAPSVPGNVAAAQGPAGGAVNVSWSASSDDVGVTGYTIYRDGSALGTVDGQTLSFTDTTTSPGTTYSYTVDAFDAAGNHSARSTASTVTTQTTTSGTFVAGADAYVVSGDATNHGKLTTLKVDNSPDTRSYLKFSVSGLSGSVTGATLKIFSNSTLNAGFSVRSVSDSSWTETGIVYANAPAPASSGVSSGPVSAGAWVSVPVTSLIPPGGGTVSLALVGLSSTALSLASRETANPPQLIVTGGGAPPSQDKSAPSVPGGVAAAQGPAGGAVNVSWSASSDDVGVTGYTVYRDGSKLGTVDGQTLGFADTTTAAGTTYSYTVDAFDAAGNHSAQSAAASVTTQSSASGTFAAAADAYVAAGDATNHGKLSTLKVDNSPDTRTYLKFSLSGLSGSVTGATLKIYANSSLSAGFSVRSVSDTSWTETGIVYANAPAPGSTGISSGAVSAGTWVSVPVTSLIPSGAGTVSLALVGVSSTALSLASRETANPPQLIVTAGGPPAPPPDTTAPSVPGNVAAAQGPAGGAVNVSWSASSDDVGVTGYTVYRDGSALGTVDGRTLSFADTTTAAGTTYSYTVDAFDAAGNHSARSTASTVTTQTTTSGTFVAVADAYVVSGDATNHGKLTTVKVDSSPDTRTYLKFSVSGLSGSVTGATLKIYANSSLNAGFSVRSVSDSSWTETGIVYANAPAPASSGVSSGAVSAGMWVNVPVTGLVPSGGGTVSLALVGVSSTALSLASRETANPPQLIVTTG